MDKQTLSQYGWVVICILVLAVMIAFATPFGNAIEGSIRDTVSTMKGNSQNTLNAAFAEAEGSGGVESPTMLNGANQVYNKAGASLLSFRSSAPIDTFQSVKVDGSVVDSSNYTVTEGSTIITFSKEYAEQLADGDHTVDIVSTTGTASTNFKTEVTAGLYDADGNMTMSWDEIKEAYPDAFSANGTVITGDTLNCCSYFTAFEGKLIINSSVKTLDSHAFSHTNLTSVVIPEGVNLANYSGAQFFQCPQLTEIYIPKSVSYGAEGFAACCESLQTIYYSGTSTEFLSIFDQHMCNGFEEVSANVHCTDGIFLIQGDELVSVS